MYQKHLTVEIIFRIKFNKNLINLIKNFHYLVFIYLYIKAQVDWVSEFRSSSMDKVQEPSNPIL
jgi:hypothetical protein